MGSASGQSRLLADIGGTNTRIALFDPDNPGLHFLQTYTNRDFPQLEDVIDTWLESLEVAPPDTCCIAIAAPPAGDRVEMVNMDWSFSRSELVSRFGFSQARWLNDFEANAFSLPYLAEEDRLQIHPGQGSGDKLATVGPGTGLGGATLEWRSEKPVARACEPGHMGLSPANEREMELFRHLYHEHGEVYTELLVSGPGLQRIYRGLATLQGSTIDRDLEPSRITARALTGEDLLARQAMETFCALLGSACGDFVLANGAYGGLYLAGGIIPQMQESLADSDFHHRFITKGAMADTLNRVPVYAITHPQPGLLGAAHAPL